MLKKISLRHFRGFKSLDADIRPITVIVGRNSSGKTSILHAVRLAVEALTIGLEEATPHLEADGNFMICRDHIVWDHDRLCPVADWAELFTDKEIGQGAAMVIQLEFEESDAIQHIWVQLSYARNVQLKMDVSVLASAASEQVAELPKRSKFRGDRARELLKRGIPRAVFVPAFYGVTRQEEYRSRALVDRLLGGGDQSRIVRNLVARLSGPAFDKLNDFLRRAGVATLVYRTSSQDAENVQHLNVSFQDTNGPLELSSAGAGLINLVALYAAMEQFRPTGEGIDRRAAMFLLDEPEAHLHPRLQGEIGEALGEIQSEFGAQLLIATHSVEMINRLGQRRDALLLSVDRAKSTAVELASEDALVRELGSWCDLTPFTSLNFLASRRILFHEGPSDGEILKRCGEIYFRNDGLKLARFRAWTMVSLDGVGNAKSQAVLGAVLSPKLFPLLSSKDPVRAVCVFDRDTERTPGRRVVKAFTRDHFEASEVVWSRYSIESLFLEPGCLAAWVSSLLPPGSVAEAELRRYVEEGIVKANVDKDLQNDAESRLMIAKMRATQDGKGAPRKQLVAPDALKLARQEVESAPHLWQNGKDRARLVLQSVRDLLPEDVHKNVVRGTILGLVEAASVEKLGDTTVLVPEEIRDLLDYMTSTGA